MATDMDFKFSRLAPRDSPDMTLTNISEKWAWSGSRDPVNFGALNANSHKMAKATNFKFGWHAPGDSPGITNVFESGCGQGHVTP